jgi:hypothetical protein
MSACPKISPPLCHTPEGLAKLDEWLAQMLGQQSKEQMACIIEANHGLLIAFLLEPSTEHASGAVSRKAKRLSE